MKRISGYWAFICVCAYGCAWRHVHVSLFYDHWLLLLLLFLLPAGSSAVSCFSTLPTIALAGVSYAPYANVVPKTILWPLFDLFIGVRTGPTHMPEYAVTNTQTCSLSFSPAVRHVSFSELFVCFRQCDATHVENIDELPIISDWWNFLMHSIVQA